MSHHYDERGAYPSNSISGDGRHSDALDALEGVIKDGFSMSSVTRIARASGSSFWVGAAIGAGLVVLATRPDMRASVAGLFGKTRASGSTPGPDAAARSDEPSRA